MKKFIVLSNNVLAFSLTFPVTGSAATLDENGPGQPGAAKAAETKQVTKEYALSRGNIVDLPEDHEHVKGMITKKLIEAYIEVEPEQPAGGGDQDHDNDQDN